MSLAIQQTTLIRLDYIKDLILDDMRRKHILADITVKYGLKEAQCDKLIRKARELMLEENKEDRPKTRAISIEGHLKQIKEVRQLSSDDITQKDRHSLIHSIKKHVDTLQGNELPKQIESMSVIKKEITVTFKTVKAPAIITIKR